MNIFKNIFKLSALILVQIGFELDQSHALESHFDEVLSEIKNAKECDGYLSNDPLFKKNIAELKNSFEYSDFKRACVSNGVSEWDNAQKVQASNLCTLVTLQLAAKVFNLNFPAMKCTLIIENHDKTEGANRMNDMLEFKDTSPSNFDLNKTELGKGLGQLTNAALAQVLKYIDPYKAKLGKYELHNLFECGTRKKFKLFFELVNDGVIPQYEDVNLKNFHPLLNLAVMNLYYGRALPNLISKGSQEPPKTMQYDFVSTVNRADTSFKIKGNIHDEVFRYAKNYNGNGDPNYQPKFETCYKDTLGIYSLYLDDRILHQDKHNALFGDGRIRAIEAEKPKSGLTLNSVPVPFLNLKGVPLKVEKSANDKEGIEANR